MIDEKQLELEDEKNEYQNGFKPREVVLKPDYPFYNHNIFFVFVLCFHNHHEARGVPRATYPSRGFCAYR